MSENRQSALEVPIDAQAPVIAVAQDFPDGLELPRHQHDRAQLIHAEAGVMSVQTDDGLWVVPVNRAVWVPEGVPHAIRMSGAVEMRTLYVAAQAAPIRGRRCCVVQVSELLRQALLRAVDFDAPYPADGPEARVAAVILDEIERAHTAPLHLPMPSDPGALRVARAFRLTPGDRRSREAWAREAGASERTLERRFLAETGLTFGKWQQQARLLRALETLAAGESVTTAALTVGFETPSAFIAMFRKALGTTPGRYFSGGP